MRHVPTVDGLADEAELVIESAVEDLALKRTIFRTLDDVADPSVILATNTSALSVADDRRGDDAARTASSAFTSSIRRRSWPSSRSSRRRCPIRPSWRVPWRPSTAWGKTPVVCADRPGFIVNRVNRPFTIEALRILEAGAASVTEIDEALRDGGFPMGPFELMDLTGIDVTLAAATGIWEGLGRPDRLRPSPIQEALVAAGDLGRKTGQGFYRYEDGRRIGGGGATADIRLGRASRPQRRSGIGSSTRSPTRRGWPPRRASHRRTSSTSRCDSVPAIRMGLSSLDPRLPDGWTLVRRRIWWRR